MEELPVDLQRQLGPGSVSVSPSNVSWPETNSKGFRVDGRTGKYVEADKDIKGKKKKKGASKEA